MYSQLFLYMHSGNALLQYWLFVKLYSFIDFFLTHFIPGKLAKPRQLHNSQWGMMCPAETPEGQVCIFAFQAYCYISTTC